MALKAGYNGIKKSLLDKLLQMSGALIIKSLGTALSLSDAGELRVRNASDSHSGVVQPDGETTYIEEGLLKAAAAGGVEVKTLTYTGNGQSTSSIDFSNEDALPTVILGICGENANDYYAASVPCLYAVQLRVYCYWATSTGQYKNGSQNVVTYTDDNTIMHIRGANSGEALNDNGKTYTVYYI